MSQVPLYYTVCERRVTDAKQVLKASMNTYFDKNTMKLGGKPKI
jgi:hypothetical protein